MFEVVEATRRVCFTKVTERQLDKEKALDLVNSSGPGRWGELPSRAKHGEVEVASEKSEGSETCFCA